MFRPLNLPEGTKGRLFLNGMPGRPPEKWDDFLAKAERVNLDIIFCLTSDHETQDKSPSYAAARASQAFPYSVNDFPIQDREAPPETQRPAFRAFILEVVGALRSGRNCLIHCAAGIGRTGTVANCVLLELGLQSDEARRAVERAGSCPEVSEQRSLIAWYSDLADGGKTRP